MGRIEKLTERIIKAIYTSLLPIQPDLVKGIAKATVKLFLEETPEIIEDIQGFIEPKIIEIHDDFMDKFKGELAKHSPVTPAEAAALQPVFGAMGIGATVSFGTLASAIETISAGQLEVPDKVFRDVLEGLAIKDIMGASTRLPYRWAVETPANHFYAYHFPTAHPPFRDLVTLRGREKISREDFEEYLRYEGIDPDHELSRPMAFRGQEIKTVGDLYDELRKGPAGYFLLAMAARSGYYDRQQFDEFLRDSAYGPEVSAMALEAFETAVTRRHRTKREDMLIDDLTKGHIGKAEFTDALKKMKYTDDVIMLIYDFFKDVEPVARKKATRALLERRFIERRMTESEFKSALAEIGYGPEWIDLIVEEATEKREEGKGLTTSQILRMYREKIRTHEEVLGNLFDLGYTEKDALDLMELYKPREET